MRAYKVCYLQFYGDENEHVDMFIDICAAENPVDVETRFSLQYRKVVTVLDVTDNLILDLGYIKRVLKEAIKDNPCAGISLDEIELMISVLKQCYKHTCFG